MVDLHDDKVSLSLLFIYLFTFNKDPRGLHPICSLSPGSGGNLPLHVGREWEVCLLAPPS